MQLLDETPTRFFCFISFAQKRGYSYEWKATKLHDWHKIGSQLLVQWTNSEPLVVSRLSIKSQQQCVFFIQSNGSVQLFQKIGTMIRSSNDSKWQACMRETDADRSRQAGHGEPWTSKRDEQGRSNARHSCLVTALHSNLEDLEAHVLAHSCERVKSDSEGEASKVVTKTEEKCSCLLPKKTKRDLFCEQNRLAWILEQSPIRCRGTSSRHSVESVSNQNFTGDGEELTKDPIAVAEAKSYSYVQFIMIWKVLWRIIMESSNNNYTLSIRHKQNRRTRCTSSKRRNIELIAANLERIADLEEWEKLDASEIHPRRINAKEVLISQKKNWIHIPSSRWYSKIFRKRLRIPRTHSEGGIHRKERECQRRISWR